MTQFDAISAEFQRVVERLSKLWEEYEEADARKDAKLVKADGYDYALRVRMMSKFLEDGIGTSTALNVVFCRSQRFPLTTLRMRRGRILGGHSGPLPLAVMFLPLKVFLWPHSYLVLDVDGNFPSTMAHEIIHAAGHDHPEDKVMKVATDRRVKGLQLGGGSIGLPLRGALWENARIEYEEVDVFEEVEGGFFDGAENDIMSYKLKKDALATKVVLRAEHKELLKNAFFVKQPRTP
ncbi:MAG TPA: hypothetical protein VFP58_02040 [Candidatus Eisenbacteria bacterium]|nr:hypothetical protein [Candidatus Eisenbacteria bacterium]